MTDAGYSSLRTKLDGQDGFATGHQVIKTAGATRHAARMRRVPVWALDDIKIKELIQKRFPLAGEDLEQRKLASRMIRVIHLYYRVGLTTEAVSGELGISVKAVEMILYRLKKQMSRELKPSHRPKRARV